MLILNCGLPEVDDWISWATRQGVDARIISFVKLFQELNKEEVLNYYRI